MNPQDQASMMYYYGQGKGGMQNPMAGMGGMQGQGYGGQEGYMSQAQQQQMQMAMMQQQMAMQQQGMTPQMMQQMQQMQQLQQLQQMQQVQQMQQMPSAGSAPAPTESKTASAPAAGPEDATPASQSAMIPPSNANSLETVTVGVFLEEVLYFMEDMDRDLWWLVRMAHQPEGPPSVVRGDEQLQPIDAATEELVQNLKGRADIHADAHANQVRAKIIIIPAVDKQERLALGALRQLKFHCKGHIEIFPCMKEANNAAIWQAYFNNVSSQEPQWLLKTDGPGGKQLFSRCAVIVPVYVDRKKKEIQLLNVWCPEKKKRHWAFPGGDILRGADRNIFDTCRRQFDNQVGKFFGKSWSECFAAELPTKSGMEIRDSGICSFVKLEQEGHRYPCRPHFFVQVTEQFYSDSRAYEDASGVIKLPKPQGDYVSFDDTSSAQRIHLDGVFFAEHDEVRWVALDYDSGKIMGDDTRQLRKENAELFRQQPEKVWRWLSELVGLEYVVRSFFLPADFPEDGPFQVRMCGIDKTATDQDIQDYFTERDVTVKKVEQFDVPRHTARIDFNDKESLEIALQLSGHSLLRRKVKVELWSDDPLAAAPKEGAKPLNPYTGPLSDDPPYKVIVKALDKSVTQRELGYFFWDRDCECLDVVYPLKNERHAGTVEFKDVESLRKAMGLNGAIFKGREVIIAIPTKEDFRSPPSRGGGSGGGGSGGGSGKGGRDSDDRGKGRGREERQPPSRAEFGSERPMLNLKPRSKPAPGEPGYQEAPDAGKASGRSNPFGAARPVADDRYKNTRADADSNWRR